MTDTAHEVQERYALANEKSIFTLAHWMGQIEAANEQLWDINRTITKMQQEGDVAPLTVTEAVDVREHLTVALRESKEAYGRLQRVIFNHRRNFGVEARRILSENYNDDV